MLNTDTISGEIISLDDDGSGKISISMNTKNEKIIPGLWIKKPYFL